MTVSTDAILFHPIWDLQLSEFCEVLGIRTEGRKPAWWLVSDWA
jgi:hypothetical protein